jgi:hypothetical protein
MVVPSGAELGHMYPFAVILGVALFPFRANGQAAPKPPGPRALADLSIDELMHVGCFLPAWGFASQPAVPAYNRPDARLGWAPVQRLDLSLVLQNLLDPRLVEYEGDVDLVTQISRSVYGEIAWRF